MQTYVVWNIESGEEKIVNAMSLDAALVYAVDAPDGIVEGTITKMDNHWYLDDWAVHVHADDQEMCFDTPR
jgi:hypothetical protein